MNWKTPHFWWSPYQKHYRRLLSPFAILFALGSWIKYTITRPVKASFPVISVGNLVIGGAGKTPTILALAQYLKEKGGHPLVLMRGYGGSLKAPTLVDPLHHTAEEVGDEALLIAQKYPTYIARKRRNVLPLLKNAPDSSVILLDDAHQHFSLVKDFSLVVIDGHQKFGNRAIFPSGPLRESIKAGLKHANALILIGNTDEAFLNDLQEEWLKGPLLRAHLKPLTLLPVGTCIFGFSGIGYPHKFLKALQDMDLNIMGFQSFPDHYRYKEDDLRILREKAVLYQAILVTTTKDFIRIPAIHHSYIKAIDVKLVFENPAALEDLLKDVSEQKHEVTPREDVQKRRAKVLS